VKRVASFDYVRQYHALHKEIHTAIERVLAGGQLVMGPEVDRFEKDFARFLGAGECVAVASGTDALVVGLRGLEIGPGDEVITVANTAVATVSAIRQVGATPVFCDVDPDTALMDLAAVEACISERTRAVVPVHLYGNVVDVPKLIEIIGPRKIRVVEDCAQAHGAGLGGHMAGTLGDVAAFSFYPTKNLGAFGDGGLCASGDPELAARMRSLRQYGFDRDRVSQREGLNSRLDEIQAAVLNAKLPHLPGFLERRRQIAARYDDALRGIIRRVAPQAGAQHAHHLYVVRTEDRDGLREALARQGISTGIHYPQPIHRMPGYAFLGFAAGSLPHSEALAREVLSLPLYPELHDEEVDRVTAAIRDCLGGARADSRIV